MPLDTPPSPVAPPADSPIWSGRALGLLGVAVLLILALFNRQVGGWLLAGAGVIAAATLASPRRGATSGGERTGEARNPAAPTLDDALAAQVFETLDDPMLVISGGEPDDLAGRRVVAANAAARNLLRIPREGAVLVSGLRDPGVLEAVDEALFARIETSVTYVTGGAQQRSWTASVWPLPSPDTAPTALLRLRDETDARRMEAMRVDFLANASHELRTPLASLAGFIETLKGHAREDPQARDRFLDIMAAQADRMGRLIADLLSLSRIELNEHIAPSGRVDLARAASDVVDALSVLTQERGVTVALSIEGERPTIEGDRDEIVQVIQNLIDNAVKYSDPGQTVFVCVSEAGFTGGDLSWRGEAKRLPLLTPDRPAGSAYAGLVVRDHGPGLAREHLPRLTERFYRVEGQKSGARPGTGLGLAIVKHIVNRHRGGLAVESLVGEGTAFVVELPLAAAAEGRNRSVTSAS